MRQLHLALMVHDLKLDTLVWIWHIACRFTDHAVKVHIMFLRHVDQHHLTSLIYKMDHMRKKWNRDIELVFYSKDQFPEKFASAKTHDLEIAEFIGHLRECGIDYVVFAETNILLARQNLDDIFDLCDLRENWCVEGSYLYGKNLTEDREWIKVGDPIRTTEDELRKNHPRIGIFTNNTIRGSYHSSWIQDLKFRYLDDENIYIEEARDISKRTYSGVC